ncbi:aspartate 1-decarboxylase autocleavage activator PanM [Escherichia coli]
MKLTIIRLENFSDQDRIDLQKIWPEYSPSSLQVDDNHRIYAARFNERLLAAVRVTLSGTEGALDSLCVREVTRRRGVGQYLLEEVLRNNPGVSCWHWDLRRNRAAGRSVNRQVDFKSDDQREIA